MFKAGFINLADRMIDKMQLSFRSSLPSIGLKTSDLIGRVVLYTPSLTYVLNPDIL